MFTIIGGDSNEYGPVTVEELRGWIEGGRANAQTRARRQGEADWLPLASFPDFAEALATQAGHLPAPADSPTSDDSPTDADDTFTSVEDLLARDYEINMGYCLGRAWDFVLGDFWNVFLISGLIILILFLVNSFYLGFLLNGPLLGGLFWYYLKRIRGEEATIQHSFAGFHKKFLQLFLCGLVSSALIFLGFLALILPGIYLSVAWNLALVVIMDRDVEFWQALEISRKALTKHWWSAFGFGLVSVLINLGGALLCGVGLLFTIPLTMAAWAYLYEDSFGTAHEQTEPA
jgi:hypothetical protein